ncbi:protein toll-like [Zeugodacus cucurbitae]|uniref:protein toll-like n=1 Tax=Zeugodacus cucurbitae TaxID=28588 RepID=UPI0023D8FEFD|nr:protein toll-like [Zeugodacus cucurbitae]
MAGNPMMCDCKLAWIFNDNLHTLFSDLKCNQTSTKLLTDIAQLERNELCACQPVMCPKKCNCYIQSKSLIINCYDGQLDVIEQLPRTEQVSLVSQLYASNNKITNISLFQLPTNLTALDLRNNYLESLSTEFLRAILNDSSKLETLYLSENLLFCDCAAQDLIYTVRVHRKRIPDVEQLHCVNLQNVTLLTANVGELCQTAVNVERYQYMIAIGTTVVVIIIILLIIAALYYKYQTEVKIWLYGHNIFSCCIHELELDENKTFDAFISYSHQDADFVNHTLLPQLEQSEPPFCVCTHERNWLAGAYIPEQIIESVDQSRRTIIVLSQHFIESDWARMEFRTAHQCSMKEGRARIIMIKYGELTNTELLDKDLKAYLDMNTYLDWQDPRFWDKLRYAMPHKMGREQHAGMLEVGGRMLVVGQDLSFPQQESLNL